MIKITKLKRMTAFFQFFLFIIIICCISISTLTAKKNLIVKIGVYENNPKIYTNKNSEVSGFWADITRDIAQKEDWEIEWVHGTWNQCLQRLGNNEIDIMIDVGVTSARQEKFAFSTEIVLMSWTRLYTQKGTEIQSILDLEGKNIAGLKGSFNIEGPEGLKDIIENFNINCEIIEMDDYIKVFEALENKEIYAGITNKDFGNQHEQDYHVQRSSIIFQPARMQFAFSKNSELTPHLIEKIDFQIKELKKDNNSIYYSSMEKYLGNINKLTIFPLWIKITIVIILTFAIIFFIFTLILKNQVKQKTQELRRDISKRKQAEKTLKESEKKYSSLFASSNEGIAIHKLIHDDSGKIIDYELLDVNLAFEKITGLKKEDSIGKMATEIYGTKTAPYLEIYSKVSESGKPHKFEVVFEPMNIFFRISVFSYEKGIFITLFSDITKSKQTEKELEKHRNHLKELVKKRTAELEEKNKKLEHYNSLFENRELRIKELRDKVKELERNNG